jgi:hypothetical protein
VRIQGKRIHGGKDTQRRPAGALLQDHGHSGGAGCRHRRMMFTGAHHRRERHSMRYGDPTYCTPRQRPTQPRPCSPRDPSSPRWPRRTAAPGHC